MSDTNPPSQPEDPAVINNRMISLADSTREAALHVIRRSGLSRPMTTENETHVLETLKNTSVMLWKMAETARVVAENEKLRLQVEMERFKLGMQRLGMQREETDDVSGW